MGVKIEVIVHSSCILQTMRQEEKMTRSSTNVRDKEMFEIRLDIGTIWLFLILHYKLYI
jgi:hypothetical protein